MPIPKHALRSFTLIRTVRKNIISMKGFTLIELLIVIAMVGILSAAVIVAINPADKIKASNDATIQSIIGQAATAVSTYIASKGSFPISGNWSELQNNLINSGELKNTMATPSGYTIFAGVTATTAKIRADLQSAKYSATPNWVWCFGSAKASAMPDTSCPP